MIELRHLRYAVAVADAGHMTRAAVQLGIQQPPLSQQIRALETMLGTPLFHRLPRGVALTAAGEVFVERARLILGDVDLAVEATQRSARGEQGNLAVGFTSSAAFHPLVSSMVRSLKQSAPDVSLVLEEASTGDLIEALRAGRLDVAFVRSPVDASAGLIIEPILVEEMLVALPDQHPLVTGAPSRRKHGISPRRLPLLGLANETFILYRRPSGPGLYDSIIAACRAAGFSPRIGQEAPRMLSTLSLVAASLGISVVPESMARLEANGVAYFRIETSAGLIAPLHLAYRDETPSGVVQRFIESVRRHRKDGAV
ncbi:LysR family transcriptional regulator [Rhizobium sp. BK602]|uniref:LysR family transcriptional regulator n=1 Tax=Rhizobium sp. BK602 TaxID=2586986 RepID=UPI001610E1E1|nr:LysR family transcriptional regulator [Rhizobium sp. BK602]MBB3610714.1 DNA-binding transcriptional LysR family regulator [Rhizobium sp. BK602]